MRLVESERRPVRLGRRPIVPRALQGDAQVVLEDRHLTLQLHRPCQRPQRVHEALLLDQDQPEVVHRPDIAIVDQNRLTIRVDRVLQPPQLMVRATLEPESHARLGVEDQRLVDLVQRFLRPVRVQQHAREVEPALHMLRVQLQRGLERRLGALGLIRLPRRQPEHVEAPGVVGPALGVAREQLDSLVVAPVEERRLGLLVGDFLRLGLLDGRHFDRLHHRDRRLDRGRQRHLGRDLRLRSPTLDHRLLPSVATTADHGQRQEQNRECGGAEDHLASELELSQHGVPPLVGRRQGARCEFRCRLRRRQAGCPAAGPGRADGVTVDLTTGSVWVGRRRTTPTRHLLCSSGHPARRRDVSGRTPRTAPRHARLRGTRCG